MKTKIFGVLLLLEALFMVSAMGVALWYGEDDWKALFVGAFYTSIAGGVLSFVGSRMPEEEELSRRDCYLVVALVWVVFSLFGMIPYLAHGTVDNVTDAFFETMSGFSTTGASVLDNIDAQPHGILFWRSITQWMGGLGIVVFSFALIPAYELKNTNMFSAEVTGLSVDKLRPKIAATARRLLNIYLILTGACALSYWVCDMSVYDSVCHAMCTIATGGFSTHQASLAWFASPTIEYVSAFYMFMAGVNFSLFYYASIGRFSVLGRNEELRWYVGVVAAFIVLSITLFYTLEDGSTSSDVVLSSIPSDFEGKLRSSVFHVTAIITSTGFQSQQCDYVAWGSMFWMPTMLLMVVGACAGSTGGGIKLIRISVVVKDVLNEFRLQIHPRAVLPVRLNGTVLEEQKVTRALAFVIIYVFIICIGAIVFTLMGMDTSTALGSSVSMLSNTGPGMGATGPMSNYAACAPAAKWVMSLFMLTGRLEIFTVLFLFIPSFWRDRI